MDPINPLDGLSELLRKRVATELSSNIDKKSAKKSSASQLNPPLQRSTIETLRKKIALSTQTIDKTDAKFDQKILHIFVENILVWQFGEDLMNDPKFSSLIDDVGASLEKEPIIVQLLLDDITNLPIP